MGKKKTPEREKIHVLVCTPTNGDVKRGYAFSVAQAIAYFAQIKSDFDKYIDIQGVNSSNLVENRHILVSRAFMAEATHLLFWDSDIKAPPDCIVRLLEHGHPIVAINYSKKEPEARPTAFLDTDNYVGPCWTQDHHTGLQEVSSCGFGLMLIDMRVLQALKTPLFKFEQIGAEGIQTLSEDVYFCHKAREAGFPVLIDHDLSKRCSHIGDWEYTTAQADIAQSAKQEIYRRMPTTGPEVAH